MTKNSDGTNVINGSYDMQFKLYDAVSGGNLLWTETWDAGTSKVAVSSGVFSVKLGTHSSLANIDFATDSLYLTVNFNPGAGYDGEMSPRKRLVSAAYALNANSAVGDGRLDLVSTATTSPAGKLTYNPVTATTSPAVVITAGANVQGAALNVVQNGTGYAALFNGGNVGIGTTTPGQALVVAGSARILGAFYDSNNASGTLGMILQTTGSGTQWVATSTLGISGGSLSGGTTGKLAVWASPSSLTSGLLLDNGTVAGVNATSTSYTFNIQGTAGTNPFNIASSTGASLLSVIQNGNVGIGTSSPVQRLSLQGNLLGTGHAAFGNGVSVNNPIGLGTDPASNTLSLFDTVTSVPIGGAAGINTILVASSTGDAFGWIYGTNNEVYLKGPSNYNYTIGLQSAVYTETDTVSVGYLVGAEISAYSQPNTATSTWGIRVNNDNGVLNTGLEVNSYKDAAETRAGDMYGGVLSVDNESVVGSGTTTTRGLAVYVNRNGATGGVQQTYGLDVDLWYLDNAGAGDHTAYGIYLQGMPAADVNYAIYSSFYADSYLAGKLGIGTTTPAATLAVQGTSSAPTLNPFIVASSTGSAMFTVSPSGNVGIGIAPQALVSEKLAVQGTILAKDWTTAGFPNLFVGDDVFLTDLDVNNTMGIYGNSDTNQAHLRLGAAGAALSGVGGNLGVGTTTPADKLDVAGKVQFNAMGIARSGSLGSLPASQTGLYFGYDSGNDRAFFASGQTNGSGSFTTRKAAVFDYATFLFTRDGSNADMFISSLGRVGIATTTPDRALTVVGDIRATGGIYDSANSAGTLGMILQTTGSGTQWVATSTLGISGGSLSGGTTGKLAVWASPSSLTSGLLLDNGTVAGVNATSTSYTFNIQGTAGTNPFNIASSTGASLLSVIQNGNVGIGTSSPISRLTIDGSTGASGANAIAGIYASTTLTNTTASGFQFGNRMVSTVNGSASGTLSGLFVRTIDSTALANTVRGLEVQAYSGSNTAGINTGIASFGKTFGVHAVTSATAGGISQPAAVFADLDNSASTTLGNALRAYTNDATTANLVSFYQETSAYAGTGLQMSFGNNSGSFTGNFIDLQKSGSAKFKVDHLGRTVIGSGAIGSMLDVSSSTSASNIDLFRILSDVGGAGNVKARIDSDGDLFLDGNITASSTSITAGSADLAEEYNVLDDAGVGEIVAAVAGVDVKKSASAYQANVLGVISGQAGIVLSLRDISGAPTVANPKPVALAGRVPVRLASDSPAVAPGDYLAASGEPGKAMKAARSGFVIGQALDFADPAAGQATVMVFVKTGYVNINNTFVLESEAGQLAGSAQGQDLLAAAQASFLINQKGSAHILQLQAKGQDRFMVATSGSVAILGEGLLPEENILRVDSGTTTLFAIRATGEVVAKGHLVAGKDTAGSAVIRQGHNQTEIKFETAYRSVPKISATAQGLPDFFFGIVEKTGRGFFIRTSKTMEADFVFDWVALEQGEETESFSSLNLEVVSAPVAQSAPAAQNPQEPEGEVSGAAVSGREAEEASKTPAQPESGEEHAETAPVQDEPSAMQE